MVQGQGRLRHSAEAGHRFAAVDGQLRSQGKDRAQGQARDPSVSASVRFLKFFAVDGFIQGLCGRYRRVGESAMSQRENVQGCGSVVRQLPTRSYKVGIG